MSSSDGQVENPALAFRRLQQKAAELGVTGEQLASLYAVQALKVKPSYSRLKSGWY